MPKDQIYDHPIDPVPPFEFDEAVVRVFDDMLTRSIPLYGEIIKRQAQLIDRYYQADTRIYDLGCSNGNLGLEICRVLGRRPFDMAAVDRSEPMIKAYAERLGNLPHSGRVELLCSDIGTIKIECASAVAMNFTLQFIAPGQRHELVKRIFDSLVPDGIFLFCEKIDHLDSNMAELHQTMYYDFKKENGYSDLEISQKREALDKVLIPEPLEVHLQRLRETGFRVVDLWLKWFNFAGLIAVK